jgi:5-methylcytosine-specific restriction enzyme subunit McrC
LDEKGVVPLKPDLCLVHNQRVLWVGDVKYKRLPGSTYLNADLYQLLAYAIGFDLPEGTLIYAADDGLASAEHVVVHNHIRLRSIALDLGDPPAKLLKSIENIAQRILARPFGAGACRKGSTLSSQSESWMKPNL